MSQTSQQPITNFNDSEIQSLCESLRPLRAIAANPSLRPLLHNPFFAELAFRVRLDSCRDGSRLRIPTNSL